MQYRLHTNKLLTDTTRYISLVPTNQPLQFVAGQYVEFVVSENELAPFSVANAPREDGVLEFFIRENKSDPLLQALLAQCTPKATLSVLGPFGECIYRPLKQEVVILLAGGVGIAQIKSILEQAIRVKDPRQFYLYWGINAPTDNFLVAALLQWQQALAQFEAEVVVSGTANVIEKICNSFKDLAHCAVYSCGPWQMTDDAYAQFIKHGLPKAQMYSDRFAFT